jgi:hypothetical protein
LKNILVNVTRVHQSEARDRVVGCNLQSFHFFSFQLVQ